MNRKLLTLSLGVVIGAAGLSIVAPANSRAAAAATPTPKSSTTPKSSKKGVCASVKGKWAHMECQEYHSSAPGDEYFGRMKMSYLGIDNTYKDGSISAGAYTTDPHLISKLDFATEALKNWAAKYPGDPQLPRSYFLGVQVLRKVYTQPEQQTTWEFIQILVHKYGNTYFGKVTKASIAHGYTEHWFALAEVCPTPLPKGVMPQTTPNGTPQPSPAPGQANVDVITPPCVQAPAGDLSAPASPSPKPQSRT